MQHLVYAIKFFSLACSPIQCYAFPGYYYYYYCYDYFSCRITFSSCTVCSDKTPQSAQLEPASAQQTN